MADIQTLLALKNIKKHYDSPDRSVTTPVLTDININIVMVTHSIELARYMKKIMSLQDEKLTPQGRLENDN